MMLSSCEKEEGFDFRLIEGTYVGTFHRSSPTTKWDGSSVALVFENGAFSGSSSSPKYPAICEGTYTITGTHGIDFTETCVWTADFDWSFILSGRYDVNYVGDELIISRSYGDQTYDTYRLKREANSISSGT